MFNYRLLPPPPLELLELPELLERDAPELDEYEEPFDCLFLDAEVPLDLLVDCLFIAAEAFFD